MGAAEDFLRGSGAGDDDVGAGGLVIEIVERDGLGVDVGSTEVSDDFFCAGGGAVGDEDGCRALLDEVPGGQLGHFAGAYEEDSFAIEGAEDLSCQVDGYRGDGDDAGADLSFGADFFGYGEGSLEERFEVGGDCAYFASYGVGILDLAEDLRLTYDHAVEGAGYAEEMAYGFALAELVKVGLNVVRKDREVLVEEAEEVGFGLRLGA